MFMSWFYQRTNSRKRSRTKRTFTEAKFYTGCHIYHYYIHGVNGNCKTDISQKSDNLPRIDILVSLITINLRQVEDDMQTLFINAAKDTFEFRATTPDNGIVEGVLRYHPFLYDRETYPENPYVNQGIHMESGDTGQARGRRDIFECFWNGRLIPYTTIPGFGWCQKKGSRLPAECYSRFSGVLFTDGKFRVSATKLKFMELEKQLEKPDTHFTPTCPIQKSPRRGDIQKQFTQWLQNCHEMLDKQVKFIDYKETVTRPEVETKKKQHPWAVFSSIEQHGRRYNAGDIVKFQKAPQNIYGTVLRFFLYGEHKGDVFATGGEVEIKREPEGLYEEITKVIPIAKIDRTATDESIKKHIENERKKLPDCLKVEWPEGNDLLENAVLPAGTPIGPIKVEILNSDGDSISSRIQTGTHVIQLNVSLKVVFNGNLRSLGKYTLTLNAVLNDNITTVYGGRELPRYKQEFRVKEGIAESFSIKEFSSSLRVGVPFDIPLHMKDCYDHPTIPPNYKPTLQSRWVINNNNIIYFLQNYDLKVTLLGLKHDTQTVKISLHPGNPHSLLVKPKTNPVEVENGNPVSFKIEVHDEAGNITCIPRLKVQCQIPGFPLVLIDCSAGKAELVTKPVKQKIINGEPQKLKARFELPSQKQVAPETRELIVMPSKQISRMELFSQGEEELVLKNNEMITWRAGAVLKKLFYKLYDEAGRESPITAEIVTWGTDFNQKDLINGRLPDLQIPTHVDEEHFYQVSYQKKKNVSFCFKIPLQVLNGHDIPTPFLLQLCDEWGNPSPDKNMHVEIKPSPVTLKVSYYALEFKGYINGKSIAGPSVNLTLLPDPNKPVRLSVDFDKNGKFFAGGKFPVFSVIVISEKGNPMTAFKRADLSMLLWEGPPSISNPWLTSGLFSVSQISVTVVANEPIKLEPDYQQQTPVVFYCTDIANRILVENMTLKITDQFGNSAGQNLNGTVFISIKCPEEERNRSLPLFDGKTNTISIKLKEGSALINSLAIMENSPGDNGSRYILHFKPEVTNPPTSLSPFELPFHFYNDAENQQKKIQLMKKKDELTEAIKECNKNFDTISKKKDFLKSKSYLVISWLLQGDMDCVITTTTAAAQKLYEDTQGNQQVMALDSILVQQQDRPLPHIQNRQELFKPSGNPTFARKHLIYPSLLFSLSVFKNLLGDTIVMDDLFSATNYRKLVHKCIQCPTILTRTGERVSNKGKFGGAQNRAPSIDQLKVFGAPLPDSYEELKKQIDVLHRYCAAVGEIEKAEKDLNHHCPKWVDEMLQAKIQMNAMDEELEKINKQLGMSSICFIYLILELI
uniref:Structural maintenance of chromosomes flexible hinge domain containing 1 n=1 Tax=Xiphophorus maculatus TaxID=8083 RepID=M3ZIZ6_XIPMA